LIHRGGGSIHPIADGLEHCLFVLQGQVDLYLGGDRCSLEEGGYAWIPPDASYGFKGTSEENEPSRMLWLRRRYEPTSGYAVPQAVIGNERNVARVPEDTYEEQHLIPYEDISFDLGLNLLTFEPGVYFGFVESHVMEHGLYMLEGSGIYWLNGDYMGVEKDDFVYMAAFCPQFFFAAGWGRSRYILYKDVNRDYIADL
jgi:(S)-ureidoglycine aminohydrolase